MGGVKWGVLAVVLIGLAACQTTGTTGTTETALRAPERNWGPWRDIGEFESAVYFVWPKKWPRFDVNRKERQETYKFIKQERWAWKTGEALLERATGSGHYDLPVNADRFIRGVGDWETLRDIKLAVKASQIAKATNKIGPYAYALSTDNTLGIPCFVFLQRLPLEGGAGGDVSTSAFGGYIHGYSCDFERKASAKKYEGWWHMVMQGLRYRN